MHGKSQETTMFKEVIRHPLALETDIIAGITAGCSLSGVVRVEAKLCSNTPLYFLVILIQQEVKLL